MSKVKLSSGKTVEMREPKVRDMRAVKHIKDPEDRELAIFVNLAEMTEDEILDLPLKDYEKLQRAFEGFLDRES